MDFKNFLLGKEPDFKGRMIDEIWDFTDIQIEVNHDFIQLIFPLNKKVSRHFMDIILIVKISLYTSFNYIDVIVT